MHSSTSNSESRAATWAIVALLVGLILYCVALELGTRYGYSRASRIQHRITDDLQVARTLKPESARGAPRVLLVGNSVLLAGVDRAALKRTMGPHYDTALLPIENTQFNDWYFGLRRIFSEGSHPSVVVVCLTTRHLVSRATCGEYFAHFLMLRNDLFAVKRESGLNNTVTSDYFFASYSEWLGSRGQIKNWLLHQILPSLDRLVGFFPSPNRPLPPAEDVVAQALPRLKSLDQVCSDHGVRLIVVVPPPNSREDGSAELQAAAARSGITVLVPMRPDELSAKEFSDGFHLNAQGAAHFTESLSTALSQNLESHAGAR